MQKNDPRYAHLVQILREELVPAMGCTEPIAIAYGAAKARAILGCLPESVEVMASGNIIKNVKSVVVPNTGGLKGIEAAAAAGLVAGEAERLLEVIAHVPEEKHGAIRAYLEDCPIEVRPLESGCVLDIVLTLEKGGHTVKVRIAGSHTNVVLLERDGEVLRRGPEPGGAERRERAALNVADILDFAGTAELSDIEGLIRTQLDCNLALARAGMERDYGANIGKVLLDMSGNDVRTRAKAMAAAGSDARMNGCELPVIINSGSGNQGITASVPVLVYAEELKVSEEKKYRALALSNLTAIHQKTPIGRLSAYCGAVSAGVGAGAGIAYLCGGGYREIIHTVVNAVAIVSGLVCDGAKASCAAKIASSVDAGILGYYMYKNGQQFYGGDGLVTKGVEATLKNIGRLGKEGMKETNREIIRIMTEEPC